MCVLSVVVDRWREDWQPYTFYPDSTAPTPDMDKLRQDIAEFEKILKKARKWDEEHPSEPCTETKDKIEALREIVKALGLEEEVEIILKELVE